MKRLILTITIITIFFIVFTTPTFASVEGITSDNYLTYEKTYEDTYGYNKGECDKPYLEGEEYFYNEYYDHWNVDKIYDRNLLVEQGIIEDNAFTTEEIATEEVTTEEITTEEITTEEITTVTPTTVTPTTVKTTSTTTNKKKSNLTIAKNWAKSHYNKPIKVVKTNKVPKKRKGTVYIEKIKTKSDGGRNGHTTKGNYYVKYPKKVKKGKKVTMYLIYNPYSNYYDDVVAVVCLGKVK